MFPRLPILIWRYTLAELWRVVLLTGAVVVTIIAFAATVQPLAEGKLEPADAIRFMFLAFVPMLAYALPFAAGFGATLAFHRMAQDNEVVGAYAGGMSHRTVLFPALASGIVLGLVLSALNEAAIPRFLRSMEKMVSQELSRLIVNTIQNGQTIEQQGVMIYADAARRFGADGDAYERIGLSRYAMVNLDDEGGVKTEAMGGTAWGWLYDVTDRGREGAIMRLYLEDGRGTGENVQADLEGADLSFFVPGAFREKPKFMHWRELHRLRTEPDRLAQIDTRRRDLAHHLALRRTVAVINEELLTKGQVTLVRDDMPFVVRAKEIRYVGRGRGWRIVPTRPGRPIEVERHNDSTGRRPPTVHLAGQGWIEADMGLGPEQRSLEFQVTLRDVASRRADEDSMPPGGRELLEFKGLRPALDPLPDLLEMTSAQLLDIARPKTEGENADPFLIPPTRDLEHRITKLNRQITAKQNERVAMSAACLVMVLCGAVTALRLRESLPLTVYLWSFFPALVALLTISAGEQMVVPVGWPGVAVLWSGVIGLSAYTALAYRGLVRH